MEIVRDDTIKRLLRGKENMKTITQKHYELLKKCGFYKKNLGHNIHLCTIYGAAKREEFPLWKRILSHVYVIMIFRIVDETER